MAKINFNKLNLTFKQEVKEVKLNESSEQVIEVVQYLPTFKKLQLVNEVIINSVLNGVVNSQLLDYVFDRAIISHYTNINFTEKQLGDDKVYDAIITSGLFDRIWDAIPEEEKNTLLNNLKIQEQKVDKLLLAMSTGLSNKTENFKETLDYIVAKGPGAEALKEMGLGDLAQK